MLLAVVAIVVTIATKGATTNFFTAMFKGLGATGSFLSTAGAVAGGAATGAAASIVSQGETA